ncbi:bacterial-like globin [Nitzschia inconspicua]|uniref:Bacterial-like globin n=1 Tax=Nitzschia inconspicua TaxID=303405 RepID=A0A9K3PFB5_9STRA|nr:bacterial-like globin [Nitzschia inconspicua]
MKFAVTLLSTILFGSVMGDHNATDAPETLCVKYTKAVFGEDSADNQLALMEAVVNLAVLGDADLGVPGILAEEGGLAPFFTGEAGNTTNRGDMAVSVNFLDGAGDLPTPDPSSNTAMLLSHLYQFFGALLGCTAPGFPAYQGDPDMYRVHKFMELDEIQMGYFNSQVAMAAAALGVAEDDVATIGMVLDSLFNVRCAPPLTADSGVPSFMVGTQPSICVASSCRVADDSACPEAETGPPTTESPSMPMEEDTICVKYTKAVFGEDSADNQLALMEAVVNLAVLGDADLDVPGILAEEGGLAPFFTGEAGNTTNRGDMAVSVNFLDGAGDLPNPDPSSNTAMLLSHLYQFFGALLGCTAPGFPAYQGDPDMYRVHKFMELDEIQMGYFNSQVAMAAAALGVAEDDVATIGMVLDSMFNVRCAPPLTTDSGVPSFMVGTQPSICVASSCRVADDSACPEAETIPPTTESPSMPMEEDTICIKYTKAIFGEDSADNQLALMEAVVNLAVLGDADLDVPGILAEEGGLAPFFTGEAGNTTNRGDMAVSVNFLDGAGDLPTPDPSSNTAMLLSHLYQFFGALLGCTAPGFPAYQGDPDMYRVHKFMELDEIQMGYFNSQVALAANALGVGLGDVVEIRKVLDSLFNIQCAPLVMANSGLPAILVGTNPSICIASSCVVAARSACPGEEAPATLCVKYTKAVFGEDSADNQLALMEAVVNLAVLGDADLGVPGILAEEGGLAPFFTGEAGNTTNRGDMAVSVNFLDGAGDLPTPDPSSNTAMLLSHLYQFFGALLGCTAPGFPAYQGDPDMYRVHKFMELDEIQMGYFNSQVAMAAAALGVAEDDVATIGMVLDSLFNVRCTPPLTADSGVPSFMVGTQPSICVESTCRVANDSACPPEEVDSNDGNVTDSGDDPTGDSSSESRNGILGSIFGAVFAVFISAI